MEAHYRNQLVKTIRDALIETDDGWEIEEHPLNEESADDVVDEIWELFRMDLDYYGIRYDADDLWSQFTPIVGDCVADAVRDKKIREYAARN